MPSPTAATTSPAMAGPITRAELNMAEFSEMALSRSSLLVIWMISDCRAGISNALMQPSITAKASTCQTCTRPEIVSSREAQGLEHRKRLGHDDQFPARIAVGRQAAQASEGEDGDLRAEPRRAQQQFGVGQPVDQPGLRHVLHPGADQGNDLAGDEEAEVAVPQGAEGLLAARPRKFCSGRTVGGASGSVESSWRTIDGGVFSCEGMESAILLFRIARYNGTSNLIHRRYRLAEDKLYKAEYLGSGTFIISKPKRKRRRCARRN